jgi:ADP-heptose:LPS heptosyltransferase
VLDFPPALREALSRRGERLTVLVLRLGALGDVVRTVPPMRLLRRALPEAKIHWVLEDKWRVAVEGHADLDGIVTVPRKELSRLAGNPLRWSALAGTLGGLRSRLRAVEPGLLLDFHGNLRSAFTGFLSGAPVRLGYEGHQQKEGNRWFTTHRVPSGSRRTPRMERNLDLIRALGLPDAPLPSGDLPMARAGREGAKAVLRELADDRPHAIVSPGASAAQAAKKPPTEALAAVCSRLHARGILPLVVWGPGEEPDARAVVDRAGGIARYAPPTDLPTLTALLADARLFVGGDSGPMHLACASGCPVVAIYGPTDPQVNRPWGVAHRAVFPSDRQYTGIKRIDRTHGFEGLTSEQVVGAVDSILDESTS